MSRISPAKYSAGLILSPVIRTYKILAKVKLVPNFVEFESGGPDNSFGNLLSKVTSYFQSLQTHWRKRKNGSSWSHMRNFEKEAA